MAVPADTLAESDGPLLEVVTQGPLSVNSKVFSAIALFALINGCLLNLVMASRLMYGMANEGVVPEVLGRVHPGRRTPWMAIIFTASIAAVLVVLGDLDDARRHDRPAAVVRVHRRPRVADRAAQDAGPTTSISAPGRPCRSSGS